MRGSCKWVAVAALVAVGVAVLWSPEIARGVDYTAVTISQLEANNSNGSSLWATNHPSTSLWPVQLVGVVVNKPSDMLNCTYSSSSNPSPQFQVFVQALSSGGTYGGYTVMPGDFGGVAVYEGMTTSWKPTDPMASFSPSDWATELARIGASTLNVGDVVLVQAKTPGVFYNGKFNINTNHLTSPDNQFSITVLDHITPTAASITLSDLASRPITLPDMYNYIPTNNNYIFDSTRATGCEKYQGSLVHLDNLLLTDPNDWGLGKTVLVSQGSSLTFPMQIGLDSALSSLDPTSLANHPFSVTAILDQEGGNYQAGYSLWLTSASNLSTVPEPGSLVLIVTASLAVLAFGRGRIVGSLPR
jgi:hypothetical protein